LVKVWVKGKGGRALARGETKSRGQLKKRFSHARGDNITADMKGWWEGESAKGRRSEAADGRGGIRIGVTESASTAQKSLKRSCLKGGSWKDAGETTSGGLHDEAREPSRDGVFQ